MREFDFKEFRQNLQLDFDKVRATLENIEDFTFNQMHHDGYALDTEFLEDLLEQIALKLEFAYDFMGLEKMSVKLNDELREFHGNFHYTLQHGIIDIVYSPVDVILQKHFNAITSHLKVEDSDKEIEDSMNLLERILRGTAKILKDGNIEPSNENEVRNEVYRILIHVFPFTVREIPIAKVSKSYKPDIGIKSLKCAVEYKFADNETEAKKAIEGIFADIQGYEGSEDWKTFYAVIYMTDNFMTQDQVEAEFKLSKVPYNWKPIVVYGKGGRKRKK